MIPYLGIFTYLHKSDVFPLEVVPQSHKIEIVADKDHGLFHKCVLLLGQNVTHKKLESGLNRIVDTVGGELAKDMRQLHENLTDTAQHSRIRRLNLTCIIKTPEKT